MRYFIGILIILLGVTAFLQSSGVITDQRVKDSIGSALVVAIGVLVFVWKRRSWALASILVLVGITDFVENQQWPMFENRTPWEYVWPLFIIILGLHVLLSRRGASNVNDAQKS